MKARPARAPDLQALFRQAVEHHKAGRLPEARRLYEAALPGAPSRAFAADTLANLGALLRTQGLYDEAEARLAEAVRIAPANFSAQSNYGNLLFLKQQYEAAEACYARALALRPGDATQLFRLGLTYLAQGRYEAGLPLYELRDEKRDHPLHGLSFPEWDGSPLEGRSVLVWREQGYGDELQMARFIPALKAAGAGRVVVAPTNALIRLFSTLDGVDEVIELVGRVAVPAHDLWVLPFSLPLRLGVGLDDLRPQPYLRAPDEARARWRGFAPEGGVGFVWHGNPAQPVEKHRGLPSPEMLAPLGEHVRLIDLQEPRGDFADTAAILEQLDLVITTDTAMAHLAGAMGRPCWVMLPALGCDWRWLRERSDSPWYPSLRLWRQTEPGAWGPVVEAMARELAEHGLPKGAVA